MGNNKTLAELLKDSQNKYSIPLQNIEMNTMENMEKVGSHVKIIEIASFQTFAHTVFIFKKPISRILELPANE